MTKPLHRVAVIVGSVREARFGPIVARWISEQAARRGDMEIDMVDLAEMDLPLSMTRNEPPAVTRLGNRLRAADAFVVVTPEYNHGYPAALKVAIDWYQEEWHAKPIGFVSYGGASGGLRAVEQLRQIFAEVHAMTVRDSVSFASAWEHFDTQGLLNEPARHERSACVMLERLKWWSETLRNARQKRPYPQKIQQILLGRRQSTSGSGLFSKPLP